MATSHRIDISYRIVTGVNDTLTVNHNGAGATTVTVAAGLYLSASALAQAVQFALNVAIPTPNWTVTAEADGTYTIAVDSGTFTIAWPKPGLRDWLGFDGPVSATASAASDEASPGVFISLDPWHSDVRIQEWHGKGFGAHHQVATGQKLAQVNSWEVTARLNADELPQWRRVASHLMLGLPATWYRNVNDTTAWGYDNEDGAVQVVLTKADLEDVWQTAPHLTVLEVPLEFAEYSGADPTITDWQTAILAPEVGMRFYLKIQGIGTIFLDGEAPVGPDGVAWTPPTSKGRSYELLAGTLDTSAGIRDIGPDVSRRTSQVQSSALTLVLSDTLGGDLRTLFARELDGMNTALLTDDMDYDAPLGTGSVVPVDDTSLWDADGYAHFGRETLYYPAKASDSLGTVGNEAIRDVFNLEDSGGDSYGDQRYEHNPNSLNATPPTITDHPDTWHGRWFSLRAFVVGPDGRAWDTAFDGGYSREIYRGVIKGNPAPTDDWSRWQINGRSIEDILNTDVVRESYTGTLLRVPGGVKANEEGQILFEDYSDPKYAKAIYLDESTRYVDLVITEYASVADWEAGTAAGAWLLSGDNRIALDQGLYSEQELRDEFDDKVSTALAATGSTIPGLELGKYSNSGKWYVRVSYYTTGEVYVVELLFTTVGSIGHLLGWRSDGKIVTDSNTAWSDKAQEVQLAVYIPPHATTIPFYFAPTQGFDVTQPPSSGYARIGEVEIVKYSSISAVGGSQSGLYQLNVTARGAMNTTPHAHVVPWSDNWTVDADAQTIRFGVGFEEVSPLEAILQLALSTGSGHHSDYDVLSAEVGPPLDPAHFDLDRFGDFIASSVAKQLPPISLFLSKPQKLAELAARWLQPLGLYLVGRPTGDGSYRITVDELLPALESAATVEVDEDHTDLRDPASWRDGLNRVVNEIEVHYRWDPLEEKNTEDTATVLDRISQKKYGELGRLTWKLQGYGLSAGEAMLVAHQLAQRQFARFAHPTDIFVVRLGRIGWTLKSGDNVLLTIPKVPTVGGAAGYQERAAKVLTAAHTYESPRGGVPQPVGSEITVIVERSFRHTTYAPSARGASYDAGQKQITFSSTWFPAGHTLADHFAVGDEVYVYNAGDVSTRDALTITDLDDMTATFDAALSNCTFNADDTVMGFRDYADCVARQQKYAFISANDGTLDSTDEGFRYV